MVVLPYELAKAIIDPIQGHAIFDLKENADTETVTRLNKALNKQDGDEEKEVKKKKLPVEPAIKDPTETPDPKSSYPPRRILNQANRKLTRTQVRTKLQKTGSFDLRTLEVLDWDSHPIKESNIDRVLDHAYGITSSRHPAGSKEIAQRLKLLEVAELPNQAFASLITSPVTVKRRRNVVGSETPRPSRSTLATPQRKRSKSGDRRVTRSWKRF